ncbi:NEDD8-like protein RUB1 [Durusdinium trenchii]|uniref:NEDD8-like protein RUB1 n=1 Tax=Durusdinium trenchii TaxID=1381693 RepID=A0ABP0HUU7_9DINO
MKVADIIFLILKVHTARPLGHKLGCPKVLEESLGGSFTPPARAGFYNLMNYVGSAFMYVNHEYSERIKLVLSSWNAVQKTTAESYARADAVDAESQAEESVHEDAEPTVKKPQEPKNIKEVKEQQKGKETKEAETTMLKMDPEVKVDMKIPTSFNEMILFNASVMGFGGSHWMKIMLVQFDDMVRSVGNFCRLQEECDVMCLVLAKYKGPIELPEFKAVVLASLRSLLPDKWDSEHEVAWCWLWENMEGLLRASLGKPAVQEAALTCFYQSEPEKIQRFTHQIFPAFLEITPAGQEFLKQSSTRILFISDKITSLLLELYRFPLKTVEESSAQGLKHVGYGIPTEMFPPFVTAAVATIQALAASEEVVEAVRWAVALIAKIMVRTLGEGSTLVMKAIHANMRTQLRKAIAIVPRCQRAREVLNITAGSQSISPFYWAIDSGRLICAEIILQDLLTIRADRDVYYYGCDSLFAYHPRVVQRLCNTAPTLLHTLMDGLVWRSRQTRQGWRRVNYYVKHLLKDSNGDISPNLACLVQHGDPVIIRHPTVVLFADVLWQRLASYQFMASKIYFLLTLCLFVVGQAALFRHSSEQTQVENVTMFCCRLMNYVASLGPLTIHEVRQLVADVRAGSFESFGCLTVPRYLLSFHECLRLALMWLLIIMFSQEPFLYCLSDKQGITMDCQQGRQHQDLYSGCAFLAMIIFWIQLLDLAIFSEKIMAYVLVCSRLVADTALFLLALLTILLAFTAAIGTLHYHVPEHGGAGAWLRELTLMALRMYAPEHYLELKESSIIVSVALSIFVFLSAIFLANLLVVQFAHTYHAAHASMKGIARLKRANITCATLKDIPQHRRMAFLDSLGLEEPLEFNEGDVGIAGGIQVLELASERVVTEDTIKRFGGPSAPSAPWPKEHIPEEEVDKLASLEKKLMKVIKSKGKAHRPSRNHGSGGSMSEENGRLTTSSVPTTIGPSMFEEE